MEIKSLKSNFETESVVKGDSKVIAIGLASIIAKVFRDEKMKTYDELYPGYNLSKHAGYPTKEHKHAVQTIDLHQFIEKHSKESKSFSKGEFFEKYYSSKIHNKGIPLFWFHLDFYENISVVK